MSARKTIPAVILVIILTLLLASVASAGSANPSGLFQSPIDTPTPTPPPPAATPTPAATPLPSGSWQVVGLHGGQAIIGGEFTSDIRFTVPVLSPGMTAAEVYLSYDPNLIEPVDVPGIGVVEIVPDFFGVSNVSINEVTNQCVGVNAPCLHIVVAGPPQSNRTGSAARPHWRCKTTGTATFVGRAAFANADGYNIPVSNAITSASVQCSVMGRITGRVTRQGVPPSANPGVTQAGSSVVAISNGTSYGPVLTAADGSFAIDNLPAGTFAVRASYLGYLQAEKPNVVISASATTVDVGTVRLLGGDVNGDCRVNILDVAQIISRFGQTGLPSSDSTDINDDGAVNISDLAIAAGNWAKVCYTPWVP